MNPFFLSPVPPATPTSTPSAPSAKPSSFLNPLALAPTGGVSGAVGAAVGGAAAAVEPKVAAAIGSLWDGTKHVARRSVEVGSEAVAVATRPTANAASDIGKGMSDMAGFLTTAVQEAGSLANKALLGELIFAGVAVLGIGTALYLGSKRSGGVTKILLGKAGESS